MSDNTMEKKEDQINKLVAEYEKSLYGQYLEDQLPLISKGYYDALKQYHSSNDSVDKEDVSVEAIENAFKQFYPNGEKCEFTAYAAAQICEVIIKNKAYLKK